MIREKYLGEQPVGTSEIVKCYNQEKYSYVAHTPTMRLPFDISDTDYAYLAFRAMLLSIHRWNLTQSGRSKIETVVCPGLGTGTGKIPPEKASKQMLLAYKTCSEILNNEDVNKCKFIRAYSIQYAIDNKKVKSNLGQSDKVKGYLS